MRSSPSLFDPRARPSFVRRVLAWLAIVASPLSGCADVDALDTCFDLADGVCARLDDCRGADDGAACTRALSDHCTDVDAAPLDRASACADDLAESCGPGLPTSCPGVGDALGCGHCGATVPDDHVRAACCELDRFSAVCGGCHE